MIIQKLAEKHLLPINNNQKFIISNCQYECIMGSFAYGVNTDMSDVDLYGFTIPPKDMIFPHLAGEIEGFGTKGPRFEQYQIHHIKDDNKEYDIKIYNIVKFFDLATKNSPDAIDSLFVPQRCITSASKIGQLVRENRKIFLSKKLKFTLLGYSYQQLHKAKTKEPSGKRKEAYEKFGFDVKYASHVVRLLDEAEQAISYGDIDLERSREMQKAIRRGDVKLEDIERLFQEKETSLQKLYTDSNVIPYSPDENAIRELLLNCLEMHYGSLDKAIVKQNQFELLLKDLKGVLNRYE